MPTFEDNRGAKTFQRTGNIRKSLFLLFLGTGEQAYLFQENKGTASPHLAPRPSLSWPEYNAIL